MKKKTYKVLVNYSQNESKLQLAWDGRRHTGPLSIPILLSILRINNSVRNIVFFLVQIETQNSIEDLTENPIARLSCLIGFHLIELLGASIELWVEPCLMVFANLGLIDSSN